MATGPILLKAAAGDQKDRWLAVRMEDPDHGDIGGICAAAHACAASPGRERRGDPARRSARAWAVGRSGSVSWPAGPARLGQPDGVSGREPGSALQPSDVGSPPQRLYPSPNVRTCGRLASLVRLYTRSACMLWRSAGISADGAQNWSICAWLRACSPDGGCAAGVAMLLEVPLVVLLGPVERGRRGDLSDDLPPQRLLLGVT